MKAIEPSFSQELARQMIWLLDSARLNGMHIMGGPGSGKSRLMGRIVAWLDLLRQVPFILLDPTGGTWANLASKIYRLPPSQQKECWKRLIYVDMSGTGTHIMPMPLFYRLHPHESLYTTSQRYLEVIRRMDPHLATASVEGWNSLSRLGTYAGMVLAALGYQITEAESLVRAPEQWQARFDKALAINPEVRPAVIFFREFMQWPPEMRSRRADALLIKLMPFQVDPGMTAMFGASKWGFRWSEIVDEGKTLILDFSRELHPERRRFKILWAFLSFVEYLKQRGIAGRSRPVSFVIDEVTQLLGYSTEEQSILAADLEELASVVARNYGVWLTVAHQSLAQVDDRIRNVLMQMGTQIMGVTPNPHDALYLAQQFLQYDPYRVKKNEPIWMGVTDPSVIHAVSVPTVIDVRSVEFSADEQLLLMANKFRSLGRFRFLVRMARSEGDTTGSLRPMSIDNIDRKQYPDFRLVSQAEELLMRRSGLPVQAILNEVSDRLKETPRPKPAPRRSATIKEDAHPLPLFSQDPEEDNDDETLREEA